MNSPRKGILMVGGQGTRLAPLTSVVNKHLLPIYDKPMVYYPLTSMIEARVKETALVCNPEDIALYQRLLGSGEQWNMSIEYIPQPESGGIAQGLLLAEDFIKDSPSMLMLGDNVFYGPELVDMFAEADKRPDGATIFAYYVSDPERYGVVDFDQNSVVKNIIEKPETPPSNYAVTGIYFYDETAVERAKSLEPSGRGELEITDLNVSYLKDNALDVMTMDMGIAWLDTGTFQSLRRAGNFIETMESRQGLMIGSPDIAALKSGFINIKELENIVDGYKQGNDYRQSLEYFIEIEGKKYV